jgi:hypothetical protein
MITYAELRPKDLKALVEAPGTVQAGKEAEE